MVDPFASGGFAPGCQIPKETKLRNWPNVNYKSGELSAGSLCKGQLQSPH